MWTIKILLLQIPTSPKQKAACLVFWKPPSQRHQQSWEMCFQLPASRLQQARGVGGGGWCLPDLFSALCKFFSDQFIEAIKKTPLPPQTGDTADTTNSWVSLTKCFDIIRLSNCWLTSYTFESKQANTARRSYFKSSLWMTVQLIPVLADDMASTILKSSWHWVSYSGEMVNLPQPQSC